MDTAKYWSGRSIAYKFVAFLGIILIGFLLSYQMAQGVEETKVEISCPSSVEPGETFLVDIEIHHVDYFDAANYDVTFDLNVLEVIGVLDGEIDGTIIPVDMWGYIPHDASSSGRIRLINNVPGVPGISGSGTLAQVYFKAIGVLGQTSTINVSDGVISNKFAEEIISLWIGDTVELSILGDVNGDGYVNSLDQTSIERIMLGLDGMTESADVNSDGILNALDMTSLDLIIMYG